MTKVEAREIVAAHAEILGNEGWTEGNIAEEAYGNLGYDVCPISVQEIIEIIRKEIATQ